LSFGDFPYGTGEMIGVSILHIPAQLFFPFSLPDKACQAGFFLFPSFITPYNQTGSIRDYYKKSTVFFLLPPQLPNRSANPIGKMALILLSLGRKT